VQGDLSPAPGGYLMYEGAAKIHQDLALALREAYGADHIHPRWGSILQQLIGTPVTADLKTKILTEVNRVISNYITVQNAQVVQSSNTGTVSSMTTDDIVQSVSDIRVQQIYDSLVVNVVLQTLNRQLININQIMS
jgi:phage baseplate assembly protein W